MRSIRLMKLVLISGVFASCMLLASCGGGSSTLPSPTSLPPTPTPPTPASAFSLSVTPTKTSVTAGATATFTIKITGAPSSVTLGLGGSSLLTTQTDPSKISYAFNPASLDNGSSTLTLNVGAKVGAGSYALSVTGAAGDATASAPLTLQVQVQAPPPTSGSPLTVTPANVSLIQGGITTLVVSAAGGGLSGDTLKLSGSEMLSKGSDDPDDDSYSGKIGYSFDNVGTGGGNLTLYVGAKVPVGGYTLTVTGTLNGPTYTTSLILQVLQTGKVYDIKPTDNYQSYLGTLQPGDVLALHAGTYSGSAVLRLNGTQEKPITIRGYGHGEAMPVLAYTGTSANEWEIRGSHLIVEGLVFDSSHTDPIRIRAPSGGGGTDDVTIVGNKFTNCGDICITANDPGVSYQNIRILYNLMLNARTTGVYIGNHQGNTPFKNFLFEGNVIDDRMMNDFSANSDIGYGIEIKLNVEDATLRNNYIVGAKGPGIMTYGLQSDKDPAHQDIVEGNIAIGSCTDQNIIVGAGPTIVRNNLSVGGHVGGYQITDYGNRHLSSGIQVVGNTALLNESSGFWVAPSPKGTGLENLQMINNLAYPLPGGIGYDHLPPNAPPAVIENNNAASPTSAMTANAKRLQTLIPSPEDLRKVWPLMSQGPLQPAQLDNLLNILAALPSQSSNSDPRSCP